jgi:hypothetical protein
MNTKRYLASPPAGCTNGSQQIQGAENGCLVERAGKTQEMPRLLFV